MDKCNEWLKKTRNINEYPDGRTFEGNRRRLVCNDGYSVSVQASRHHYCIPRINGADKYESVELGFPNVGDILISEYAEDPNDLTETVYGYVPVEVVNKLIEKHGGLID